MDGNEAINVLLEAISKDPRVKKAVERLDKGIGTYEDVNRIALRAGKRIAEQMSVDFDEAALQDYLRAGHNVVAMTAEVAQTNLNRAAGIVIKPMITKPPNARIAETAARIAEAEPAAVPAMLENTLPSFMLEMVDDIVRYNLDFQQKSGLQPIIKRTWSGQYGSHDTKHTDNCRQLAGEWNYGEQPKMVFARHEGCRCTVEYFPSKAAKGRITALAKGEIDTEGVLWNTRADTLQSRLSGARRKKK